MELGLDREGTEVSRAAEAVILLDTNALIWFDQGHPRARPLSRGGRQLYLSPATILELQFLQESGRIRLRRRDPHVVAADERWTLDDPPATSWFDMALDLSWTHDPFDRLIAAHARLRGWRLATGDGALLHALGPRHTLEL